MRHGLFLPPFGATAHPKYFGELAQQAEAAGWEGVFLWDHLVYPDVPQLVDPWIALTAIAGATRTIKLGPMVSPLPRRHPWGLARQVAALDLLSDGRLVLGVGRRDLRGGEFATFGEELDRRVRGEMLDESLSLLHQLLSGARVEHRGKHYLVDGAQFLPTPHQQPLPTWVAARWPNRAPLRRAARYQGVFVIQVGRPEEILELRSLLAGFGVGDRPFEIVVAMAPGRDPGPWEAVGVTWYLTELGPFDLRRAAVEAVVAAGPPKTRT